MNRASRPQSSRQTPSGRQAGASQLIHNTNALEILRFVRRKQHSRKIQLYFVAFSVLQRSMRIEPFPTPRIQQTKPIHLSQRHQYEHHEKFQIYFYMAASLAFRCGDYISPAVFIFAMKWNILMRSGVWLVKYVTPEILVTGTRRI